MVNFPGLPQLRLFISLCPDFEIGCRCEFRTDFGTEIMDRGSGLSRGHVGPDVWLEYGMFVA